MALHTSFEKSERSEKIGSCDKLQTSLNVPTASLTSSTHADSLLTNPVLVPTTSLSADAAVDGTVPLNFSKTRKWLIVVVISGMSTVVNLSTVICAPASLEISHEFSSNSKFLSVFYITVWNLGEAIAPLYIGPLSEHIGRLPVYHFYNFFFVIFTLIAGFSNSIGMIVAFRFLTGAFTTCICLNPSIVGDLFALQGRGVAMSVMSLMPLVGTAVGPIIGGYMTQHLSWRWTFWLTAIIAGLVELVLIVVLRETYLPRLLQRQATKNCTSSSSEAKARISLWKMPTVVLRFCFRPFAILFSSRAATVVSLYLSIVYAYLFLLAATLADVFQEVYDFSESSSGLVYIGLAVGMLIGTLFCRFTLDRLLDKTVADSSSAEGNDYRGARSERRLVPAIPAMAILPLALLLYGWTLQERMAWIAPVIAMGLAGFCLSATTIPIMNYLVDVFGDKSASAIAAVLPLRYILGTFLPVAAPYMYGRLGYGWANSLLAFVVLLCAPAPLLLIVQPTRPQVFGKLTRLVGGGGAGA